jgi:glycosyltransferase involved in cell wall biosynthesis
VIGAGPAGLSSGSGMVLQLISSGTQVAGTERHVLGLTRELVKRGCDARIVCPPSAKALRANAKEASIPIAGVSDLASRQVCVAHFHDGRAALSIPVYAATRDAVLLRTQHFVLPASGARSGAAGHATRWLHRQLNRQLDGYIAVSEAARQAAVERGDVNGPSLSVIPPGVGIPDEAMMASVRLLRQASDRKVVLTSGRLEYERRIDVLLTAMPEVLQRFPECRLMIAGSGAAEADLRREALKLGVDDAVTWTGWTPGIDNLLREAQIYVNTWPLEGFGMATAEAMAFELPVVVTTTGASAELIDGGRAGIAVPPQNPAALASAICTLLADEELARRLGSRARRRASETYSLAATAEATLSFYKSLSERRQRQAIRTCRR